MIHEKEIEKSEMEGMMGLGPPQLDKRRHSSRPSLNLR
jgi:hypothetical protein